MLCLCPFWRALEFGETKLKVLCCWVLSGTASQWSGPALQRPVCLHCGAPICQRGKVNSLPTPKVKTPPWGRADAVREGKLLDVVVEQLGSQLLCLSPKPSSFLLILFLCLYFSLSFSLSHHPQKSCVKRETGCSRLGNRFSFPKPSGKGGCVALGGVTAWSQRSYIYKCISVFWTKQNPTLKTTGVIIIPLDGRYLSS